MWDIWAWLSMTAVGAPGAQSRWSLVELIRDSGTEVWMVLLILFGFSVISWAIIIAKVLLLRKTRRETEAFFRSYEQQPTFSAIYKDVEAQGLHGNPFASIFFKGYRELLRISAAPTGAGRAQDGMTREPARLTVEWTGLESVERAVRQEGAFQVHRYEKALGFLATTGSTAPFVGLFGTVLGIIRSFHEIGLRGSASLATVAPGISEALVATAAGLAAAIPAVVAYNYFVQRIRGIASEMDQFTTEFLNLVQRQLRPRQARSDSGAATEGPRRQSAQI
ncbi:MAG: MotA/TolQ/ExbB proton channel family protein [Thermodesulfobacteriota bacterium]